MKSKYSYIKVNDIFDELKIENNRLNDELLFANKYLDILEKFKKKLDIICDKNKSVIDSNLLTEINNLETNRKHLIESKLNAKQLVNNEMIESLKSDKIIKSNVLTAKKSFRNQIKNGKYKCEFFGCGKGFGQLKYLSRHRKVHCKLFQCTVKGCERSYSSESGLRDHVLLIHELKRTIPCPEFECGKKFKTEKQLREHMKNHSKDLQFVCDLDNCDYKTYKQSRLDSHQRQTHTNEKPFKCNYSGCELSFKTYGNLKAHSFIHSNEMSFQCEFEGCGEWFKTNVNLRHHRKKHLPAQNILCDWPGCDYLTDTKTKLRYHKTLHSGEKPFTCSWPGCDKRFRMKPFLMAHLRVHNNEKPFSCSWPGCVYRSTHSANIFKHMNQVHKVRTLKDIPKFGQICN